jgi:ubiquinone/menaquinone biosynthesis C-methylase UbiE
LLGDFCNESRFQGLTVGLTCFDAATNVPTSMENMTNRDRRFTPTLDRSLSYLRRSLSSLDAAARDLAPRLLRYGQKPPRIDSLSCPVPIRTASAASSTSVDDYWTVHTVNSVPFKTAVQSLEYLDWRFREYPLFRELMGLYGTHDDQIVLDYGCGPGNDLVGYLVYSNAKKIIGVDVSPTALRLASHRLGLHASFGLSRMELIQKSDSDPSIPLDSSSVDHIYCEGVLHHTSDPDSILREFRRVLRPGGTAALMVYNAPSLWKHLYVAYEIRILGGKHSDLSLDDAFARCVDGVSCPIAHNYEPEDFIAMCRDAGFQSVTFVGGFLSDVELRALARYRDRAIADGRLEDDSREFLRALSSDHRGYPMFQGKYAGCGGVYVLN